ncbi:hypothetical protein CYR40_03180 [Chimaeribacter arupi]|uniref:Uncharacterized protein n=1 Tax=Chimaeribacter arupi TaxID=2060066 RepID=A0A2N5ESY2_9GAMM|nr:hypothetical protein CYR23_01840 [Chimaeribacter arupi]PLR46830.1 hypothetical protein CYR52_15140 [Chimaeribacter arupi]PLR49497.1 hypothetical protein CYR40_03180 [Chimaeribacter arupi]PLR53201.1 hypothetical protein CYR34_00955 [Chimaeribacter arupi]
MQAYTRIRGYPPYLISDYEQRKMQEEPRIANRAREQATEMSSLIKRALSARTKHAVIKVL